MGQLTSRAGLARGVCCGRRASYKKLVEDQPEQIPLNQERSKSDDKQARQAANRELANKVQERLSSEILEPPPFETLEVKGLLGCGGFGAVELVQQRDSGETFALKSLSKGYIVKTGMQQSVANERLICHLVKSSFVVSFYGSYNLKQEVSLLLEACLGGELYATYNRKKMHGSEPHARYYIASLILGLSHLHAASVLCRGIKPEDCVLDLHGRMKLCDMGLAKIIAGTTYTTCGTPDYFAPELIASTGHGFAVDWWCTGVMLFELLTGHPPFESAYPMQIYAKVMKGIDKVTFPDAAKPAEALIKGLMTKAPEDRLPMKQEGIDNVKNHSWYGNFDWGGLESQALIPPYVPVVESSIDISNFSAREEDRPKFIAYEDDGSGWADVFGVQIEPQLQETAAKRTQKD